MAAFEHIFAKSSNSLSNPLIVFPKALPYKQAKHVKPLQVAECHDGCWNATLAFLCRCSLAVQPTRPPQGLRPTTWSRSLASGIIKASSPTWSLCSSLKNQKHHHQVSSSILRKKQESKRHQWHQYLCSHYSILFHTVFHTVFHTIPSSCTACLGSAA